MPGNISGCRDPGKSLDSAGPKLGGDMEDAKFLQDCGIEVDPQFLLESMEEEETPPEVSRHVKDLLRIADMLGSPQF